MRLAELITLLPLPPEPLRTRMVACSAFLLVIFGGALSLGAWPGMFPGFARADGLRSVQVELTDDLLLQLREQECRLPAISPARETYAEMIQRREQDYQRLTGQPFALPACSDL